MTYIINSSSKVVAIINFLIPLFEIKWKNKVQQACRILFIIQKKNCEEIEIYILLIMSYT